MARALRSTHLAALAALAFGSTTCSSKAPAAACTPGGDGTYATTLYSSLSSYCMVSIQNGLVVPYDGVTPYDLNTPLFSDGAVKYRTVWTPPGTSAPYDDTHTFDLPVGSVLTKSFGFRDDLRKATPSIHWVETRVFVRQPAGWKAVSYTWDDAQSEATVAYGGPTVPLTWLDETGAQASTNYLVPNGNQCVECHAVSEVAEPIGPKARNINKSFTYATGIDNQLAHWAAAGIVSGVPTDPTTAPRLPVWNDPSTGSVDDRARAYLEANCAHCHSDTGFARTTGLYLWANAPVDAALGICKPPVAVGEASGGFLYDVAPGDPDHSILAFRLASTTPAVMMPQIGRSLADPVGVQLVRDWITGLAPTNASCGNR
ncbi:MAG: SO2930 family diheme c-type cytochrome [Polyangiales bacterium]